MRLHSRNLNYGRSIDFTVCNHHISSHIFNAYELLFIVLGEIESSLYRNKTQKEMELGLKLLFEKYMPLNSNTAQGTRGAQLHYERKKDHYSHFILRLAFCRSYV